MKRILISGAMIFAVLLSFGIIANAQRVLGGYKFAAVDDERVVAAAEFAVSNRVENNTEQEGLELVSVDKAEMQTVGGINYRLCLTVGLEDETQQVLVVVYQNLKKEYSLRSWIVKDCGGN